MQPTAMIPRPRAFLKLLVFKQDGDVSQTARHYIKAPYVVQGARDEHAALQQNPCHIVSNGLKDRLSETRAGKEEEEYASA